MQWYHYFIDYCLIICLLSGVTIICCLKITHNSMKVGHYFVPPSLKLTYHNGDTADMPNWKFCSVSTQHYEDVSATTTDVWLCGGHLSHSFQNASIAIISKPRIMVTQIKLNFCWNVLYASTWHRRRISPAAVHERASSVCRTQQLHVYIVRLHVTLQLTNMRNTTVNCDFYSVLVADISEACGCESPTATIGSKHFQTAVSRVCTSGVQRYIVKRQRVQKWWQRTIQN